MICMYSVCGWLVGWLVGGVDTDSCGVGSPQLARLATMADRPTGARGWKSFEALLSTILFSFNSGGQGLIYLGRML